MKPVARQMVLMRMEGGKQCNAEKFAHFFSPPPPPPPLSALFPFSVMLDVKELATLPHPSLPSSPPSPSPLARSPGTSPPPSQQSSCLVPRMSAASGTWLPPPQPPPCQASTSPPPTQGFTYWLSPAQGWLQALSWSLAMRRRWSMRRWTARSP